MHGHLPRYFFDADIVSDLSQEIDIGLDQLVFARLLVREELLLLAYVSLLELTLAFNQLHNVFEPLGEEDCVLTAGWLPEV